MILVDTAEKPYETVSKVELQVELAARKSRKLRPGKYSGPVRTESTP
jgi:hypothetical protein